MVSLFTYHQVVLGENFGFEMLFCAKTIIELSSQNDIELNRKVLADLAMNNPDGFKAVVDKVK